MSTFVDAARPEPWPDLDDFMKRHLMPFPMDTLPETARLWVDGMAKMLQMAPDMAAMAALGTASTIAMHRRVCVDIEEGWRQQIGLYVLPLTAVGLGKSPVMDRIREPLNWVKAQIHEQYQEAVNRIAPQRKTLISAIKVARKEESKALASTDNDKHGEQDGERILETIEGNATARRLRALEDALAKIPMPKKPVVIVGDTTTEALAAQLAIAPVTLLDTETQGFFRRIAGSYSGGNADFDIYLKAYTSDPSNVLRVERGVSEAGGCEMSIILLGQPSSLQQLAKIPGVSELGLLARFMYSLPPSYAGERTYLPVEEARRRGRPARPGPMPRSCQTEFHAAMLAIWTLLDPDHPQSNIPTIEDQKFGGLRRKKLEFDREAHTAFLIWRDAHEQRFKPTTGDLTGPGIHEWASKLDMQVARVAATLLVMDEVELVARRGRIGAEHVEAAIKISEYAIDHARAAYDLMSHTREATTEQRLWERIHFYATRDGWRSFRRRQLRDHLGGRLEFNTMAKLDEALSALVARGYLRVVPSGRTIAYEIRLGIDADGQVIDPKLAEAQMPAWSSAG